MKKIFFMLFFLFMLSPSFVASVEIEIKDEVKKGENFIVKVSGVFNKPISASNIAFYRRHITTEFGIVDIKKIEGDTYFYLSVPLEKLADDYSIVFEDAEYFVGQQIVKGDMRANFTIVDEVAPFRILPPLLIATDTYQVTVQNLQPSPITIDLNKEEEVTINEENEVVDTPGFFDILFGRGQEPEQNISEISNQSEEQPKEKEQFTLQSGESRVLTYQAPRLKGFEKLNLYHQGEGYGVLVYNPEGSEEVIIFSANKTGEGNESNKSIITTNATEENTTIENATTNITENIGELSSCVDLGGSVCVVGKESCTGQKVNAKDAECCIGKCSAVEESSGAKTIGWIIIAVIVLFLTWFFKKKYRKAAPGKVDLIEKSKPKK